MATEPEITPGTGNRLRLLAALLTGAVLLLPALASAQVNDVPPRPPRAHEAWQLAQEYYRSGDYESASRHFLEADAAKQQLKPAEQADLAQQIQDNNKALQASRDGHERLLQANEALKQGNLQLPTAVVKAESTNAYLKPADKVLWAKLAEQLRERGVTTSAGAPNIKYNPPPKNGEAPKQDYSTLVHKGREAYRKGNLDEAEVYAKQAEKVGGGMIPLWMHPWDDNHTKVLRDIADARVRLAAQAQKPPPSDKQPEQPPLYMRPIIAVQSLFTPGTPAPKDSALEKSPANNNGPVLNPPPGPAQTAQPGPTDVVVGPAVTPKDKANQPALPVPQASPETIKARQLVTQGYEALKKNDLVTAKKCAEQARAMNIEAQWWELQTPDTLLAEIQKHQPVQQASATVSDNKPNPAAPLELDMTAARNKLKEGRTLYSQEKFDEADRICAQLMAAKLKWGLFEDNPESLHRDVQRGRQKADQQGSVSLLTEGRKLLAAGNFQEARVKAWKARSLHGPYTFWEIGDRPDKLLADIDSAEAKDRGSKIEHRGSKIEDRKPILDPQSSILDPRSSKVTTAALAAKQRTLALLVEARTLEKQGNLQGAQGKAMEAQNVALEAYRGGVVFAPGEDTPDSVLRWLAEQCHARIQNLVQIADQQAADPAQVPAAVASLQEARQLAVSFQQDATPIDQRLPYLMQRQNPSGLAQADNQTPEPNPIGVQLLSQGQFALQAGKTKEARKFAELAYDAQYGLQDQAAKLLNSIDAEEFSQRRLEADRAFLAGYDAYLHKDFRQALGVFTQIDDRLLSEDKQKRMRELAMTPEMQPKAEKTQTVQLTGQKLNAEGGAGVATATDMGQPGGRDPSLERFEKLQNIEFQKMLNDGLEVQRRALQKAEAGDLDSATEVLRNYKTALGQSKLLPEQQAKLERPIDRYIQQFKAQQDWRTKQMAQSGDQNGGRDREKERIKKQREQETEVGQLMQQYGDLMREGKFNQAHTVAMHAKDLDPDNPAVLSALHISNIQMQQEHNDKVKGRKEKLFDDLLDEDPGPSVGMDQPVRFDKNRATKDHKTYEKGIYTDLHDPVERRIARIMEERKVPAVNFNNIPLYQAINALKDLVGDDINIVFDDTALHEAGIRKDLPLTLAVNGGQMSLRSVLNILLRNADLTWVIQNQSITITTQTYAKGNSRVVTYSVADLVVPVENHPSLEGQLEEARLKAAINQQLQGGLNYGQQTPYSSPNALPPGTPIGSASSPGSQGNTLGGSQVPKPVPAPGQSIEELLIRLITHTIAPDSWSDVGGKGTVHYYPLGLALIVNQTQDIQEQIVDLLQALRRLQDLEVAIEMRLVAVSEAFFERMGVDFSMDILHGSSRFTPQLLNGNFQPAQLPNKFTPSNFWSGLTPAGTFTPDLGVPVNPSSFSFATPPFGGYPGTLGADGGLTLGLAFLSDIQVFMIMEAAQGDRRTNTMQAPKITVFNGQTATIAVQDQLWFLTQINVLQINGQMVFQPQQQPFNYGVNMQVTPVVSADRRFVRLNLAPRLTNLISATVPLIPIQQIVPQLFYDNISPPQPQVFQMFFQQPANTQIFLNTTVVVPDGGTVLMGGLKTLVEGRNEYGPPVLSKIPYLSRLFKNVGYGREAQSLMVMVTARIIINEEEEQEFLGNIPRIPR